MNLHIVPDSPERMVDSLEHQVRVTEIRRTIELQFAEQLNSAGIFRRWFILRRIEAAFAAERRKIEPSEYAL